MHARRVVPQGDFLRGVLIALDLGKHAMVRRRAGRKILPLGLACSIVFAGWCVDTIDGEKH